MRFSNGSLVLTLRAMPLQDNTAEIPQENSAVNSGPRYISRFNRVASKAALSFRVFP